MTTFINPDRTQLPDLPDSITCPGLEALTGADICLSHLDISPVKALPVHIANRSLFVQVKNGYDILSFDNLKHAIARMQKCKIPQQQCILLFIGKDWQDDNDLLRIENSKPYGNTTYKTFIKLKAKWRFRGGVIDWLNDSEQLPMWTEAQLEAIQDIKNEGAREIYPARPVPQFEPDDIWQPITELDKNDIRYFLCAGMDGFGAKTANNTLEYIQENISHLDGMGFYYLKILTDEDEKGKPIHKVKGFGNKSRERLRGMLSLPKGFNLTIEETGLSELGRYADGWYGALRSFKELVENGHNVKDSFNSLMKQANEFYREDS
jgi:hypothetical protein